MKNKRKGNIKRVIYFIVILYIGVVLVRQETVLFDCHKQQNYYLSEIKKNQNLSTDLKQKKELYNSDVFVEKTAREKLGMVYPGEKVFKDISR
ncbi:MAG: FtsB family cell division protein [Ignavibacteriales bacterium]